MKKSMLIKDYEREVKSKQKRHKGKKRLKVILNTIGEIDSEVWSTIGILFLGGIIIVGMIMAFANIVRKEQPHAQKLEQEFNLIINNVEEGARAQSIFFKREWRLGFNNDNVPKGDLIIVTENNTDESLSPKIELAEKNGKKVSIVYEFEGKYYSAIETKDTVVKKDN
ncbi:MAG: hypothetical protein Q4G05_04000, partial [Clostridia bacterium]|nr:hypothetical protein [Clostridia bacterium]